MILGVDHIIYTVDPVFFQEVVNDFSRLNFKLRFQELSLRNPEEKRQFVSSNFCSEIAMSLLDSPIGGVPVEIITHDSVGGAERNNFELILGDKNFVDKSFLDSKVKMEEVVLGDMNRINKCRTEEPLKVSYLLLETCDFEKSLSFWRDILGFKVLNKNDSRALLHNTALNVKWRISIIISETQIRGRKNSHQQSIDTPGVSCVSFLTTRLEKDLVKAEKAGASIGGITEMRINMKNIMLAFLNTPTGELLEFIQIKGD